MRIVLDKNSVAPYSHSVKKSIYIFFVLFFFLTASFLSADSKVDFTWALQHLLLEDEADLDDAIGRVAVDFPDPDEMSLAFGLLNIYKYLRNDTVSQYAYNAFNNIDPLEPPFYDAAFIFVTKGVAHSLIAKEKTVFGVGNLQAMRDYFLLIPEGYEDWFVRFLRGSTLIQVGRNLPALFFRAMKKEATRIGTEDLEYVVDMYRKNGIYQFNPARYDAVSKPVPRPIYEQSLNFLQGE